jgi:hypothetical protein
LNKPGLGAMLSEVNAARGALKQYIVLFGFVLAIGGGLWATSPETASAHRHGCHRHHTCPSDHATYRWRGLLCVAPYSDKRNSTFKRRVRYGGRTYYCKR